MITLMSIHTVTKGREQDYIDLQRELWRLTQKEAGVVRYEHYRATRPGQFVSLLSFRDLDAFLDHQVTDYHHQANWEGLFAEHELQWLDPIPGANDLEPTELPPLAPGTDPLRRQYAEMLPAARPAWWDAAAEQESGR